MRRPFLLGLEEFGQDTQTTVDLLLGISQLLYATGDNYDSRIQAQDLIAQQNFSRTDGGLSWIFNTPTQPGKPPVFPNSTTQTQLVSLNEAQSRLDTAQRKCKSLQWQLFAEWWKFSSLSIPTSMGKIGLENTLRPIRTRVKQLVDLITTTNKYITSLTDFLKPSQNKLPKNHIGGGLIRLYA
jgi:hypothetical protein